MTYDFAVVGGGLAGATLARALAMRGRKVLLLEKTKEFSDRVRGEGMHPWGAGEAKKLGIFDILKENCAVIVPHWTIMLGEFPPNVRNLPETTPSGTGAVAFYHPDMQQALFDAAVKAGAEGIRGAEVTAFEAGDPSKLTVKLGGEHKVIEADFVVGADGRDSRLRNLAGFDVRKDEDNRNHIAGLRMRGIALDPASVTLTVPGTFGEVCAMFPTGEDVWRVYYGACDPDLVRPLTGKARIGEFVEKCVGAGAKQEWFADAVADGPLANYACADRWVDVPARENVALVGDAAGSPDPVWGAGLSMTLRSVRRFLEAIDEGQSPREIASIYVERQSSDYDRLRQVENIYYRGIFSRDPDDAAFRDTFLVAMGQGAAPDNAGLGPDNSDESLAIGRC